MAGQTGQTGTMVPAARVTRRTQLRVAAVALPTAAATACGATRPGDRQSVAPVPANPTGKVVVWSGPVHGVWEQMQPVFAERYTAITVEAARPERKQGQGTFEAMLAALAAGSGPDVLGVDATPVFMGPFVERKAVLPLDRYYAALPNLRKVFGWARREATLEGKLWGVPTATAFEAIWANKTVMDRAGITETPATWEQFLAQAAKLKAALASNHISGAGGTKSGALEKPPVPMMINFPGNAGTLFNLLRASILGRDGIASILYRDGKWDSAEMILVAQTAVELQKQAIIPPQPIDDHYVGHPNFTLGNAAWWPNGSWAVVGFENTKNTNPDQFDYRFFGLPPKQGRRAPQLVGRIVGGLLINAATKVPDAAATLCDFLISAPALKVWFTATKGELPGPVIPIAPAEFGLPPGFTAVLETLVKAGDLPANVEEMVSSSFREFEQQQMLQLLNGGISPRDYGTLVQSEWARQKQAGTLPTQQQEAKE